MAHSTLFRRGGGEGAGSLALPGLFRGGALERLVGGAGDLRDEELAGFVGTRDVLRVHCLVGNELLSDHNAFLGLVARVAALVDLELRN